ncbi:serine hydrolase [Ensifer sp. ENS09]|nr:serine hydrolase [Ensifer sp. ENS09]
MALGTNAHASPLPPPTDAEIQETLADRIDKQQQSVGIVVGIIDANGRRVIAHGHPTKGDPRAVDGQTVFEIGSITKVFTALLLADAMEKGTLSFGTPVATLLPERVIMPEDKQTPITLGDLATHMSGLPRLPSNLVPADMSNPYAGYDAAKLYAFLSSHKPQRRPGVEHEYSNLGAGLLGHAIALKSGLSYEDLIVSRIALPLGMKDTAITSRPAWAERRATGHDAAMEPVSDWDLDVLQGAGALRSTVDDLLLFLEAAMGKTASPLAPAFTTLLATRQPIGNGDQQALGWVVSGKGDEQFIWHNGGTGGYRSFVGYRPSTGVGVVALSNASTDVGVDDIGRHLLNRNAPLAPPIVKRTAIAIDPARYDAYIGTYRLAPDFELTIFRYGESLFAQATGQDRLEILPEAHHRFFTKLIDAQISFTLKGDRAESLTLHQGGQNSLAPRVSK